MPKCVSNTYIDTISGEPVKRPAGRVVSRLLLMVMSDSAGRFWNIVTSRAVMALFSRCLQRANMSGVVKQCSCTQSRSYTEVSALSPANADGATSVIELAFREL